MNRAQRRQLGKTGKKYIPVQKSDMTADELPTSRLIATINAAIIELDRRGVYIHDWDSDDKTLRRIQIRHGRYYYLSGDDTHEHSI